MSDPTQRDPTRAGCCWVCESADVRPWKRGVRDPLGPDDLRITDARYGLTLDLVQCVHCGFVFASGARGDDLVALYRRMEDAGYDESAGARRLQMQRLVDAALRARPAARTVLDIGAGTGLLVAAARARGLDAVGVEPSLAAVEAGRARLGEGALLAGTIPHPALGGRVFDVVFVVDVLEHVVDPVALLRAAREALAPGGLVVVVTPDVKSVAARLLGRRWWHFRLAHVGYFDASTLALAARRAGLHIERSERARWYFPVGYLAARVARYLPWVHRVDRLAAPAPLRGVAELVVPLDLHDSWAVHMSHARTTGDDYAGSP